MELRKSRRYRPTATALFSWEGPDGFLREERGAIRDISDRGVYIVAEQVPVLGSRLDVAVSLPPTETGVSHVELHGEGIVVRIDREGGRIAGFAAAVAFHAEPGPVKPERVN